MTMKNLMLTGALMIASLGLASAKTYNFVLPSATAAGPVNLAAGHYSLKVMGSVAEFTNLDTAKKVMVEVKVNNVGAKVDKTQVNLKDEAGAQHITSIDLQDSDSSLEF